VNPCEPRDQTDNGGAKSLLDGVTSLNVGMNTTMVDVHLVEHLMNSSMVDVNAGCDGVNPG
jgi:hypothetical protein